jgi:hypothetical protein
MTSITLLHPEETFKIPALQAITKCRLFQKNPTLLLPPYRVQSPVSLSIFREFLSALTGNSIAITSANFPSLRQLSREFGFSDLSSQLSNFNFPSKTFARLPIGARLSELRNSFPSEPFLFIVNSTEIEREISESVALFPAVREQLSVDSCARHFFITNSEIESADIHSLLSGETISKGQSPFLLSKLFENEDLERLFLNCSKPPINVSESANLSVESLDNLLLNEIVRVESEDALLNFFLKLGPSYRNLLRHVKMEFLSEHSLSLLDECLKIPPESVWQCAVKWIARPPFPFDSQIISDIPEIFGEFRRKRKLLLWRGSQDGFQAS